VQPESLRSSGDLVIGVTERFIGELESFEARMEGYGQPWGADDIGSLIGIAYTEVAAYVFDCIGVAAEELGSAGGDLTGMADAYELSDEEAAGGMRGLTDSLG
jgi:hypothetical protein